MEDLNRVIDEWSFPPALPYPHYHPIPFPHRILTPTLPEKFGSLL